MTLLASWDWDYDGWIVVTGILCAISSALLGNFLVLRKMSMLGDAISHAVLPGLAAAFFITQTRDSWYMFLGAVLVGILTALFTEWIQTAGQVDEGASMGVVFTTLFALGLVMIVQAADQVDLDANCVLYGAIELTPLDRYPFGSWEIPKAVVVLGIVTLINTIFVVCFYKELKLSSFDPALANTIGFNARLLHYMLMVLVAVTAVASFESVGNILVVAMFVVPPAAAFLLTDRLWRMILLSLVLATVSAVLGHLSAISVPTWFGFRSVSTAGMIAASAGLLLALSIVFAPTHGLLVKFFKRRFLEWKILSDDVIAILYRIEERGPAEFSSRRHIREILLSDSMSLKFVIFYLTWTRQIVESDNMLSLTAEGKESGQNLVRSHRLWEQYLVSHAGLEADRIHDKAEKLEHFTDQQLRRQLMEATSEPSVDPHGSPIPEEGSASEET